MGADMGDHEYEFGIVLQVAEERFGGTQLDMRRFGVVRRVE